MLKLFQANDSMQTRPTRHGWFRRTRVSLFVPIALTWLCKLSCFLFIFCWMNDVFLCCLFSFMGGMFLHSSYRVQGIMVRFTCRLSRCIIFRFKANLQCVICTTVILFARTYVSAITFLNWFYEWLYCNEASSSSSHPWHLPLVQWEKMKGRW